MKSAKLRTVIPILLLAGTGSLIIANISARDPQRPVEAPVVTTMGLNTMQTACNPANVMPSSNPDIVRLANTITAFRASLTDEQRTAATFPVGDVEQFSWTNLPPSITGDRGGITFGDLNDLQMDLLFEAMDAFLSADGLNKVNLITRDVESLLSRQNSNMFSSNLYHIAMFGNAESDGLWGYQLDGHHLAINFLVCGETASIVPAFIGTQPEVVNGTVVLGDERNLGFNLVQNLDEDQRGEAILPGSRGLQVEPGRNEDNNRNFDYSVFDGIGLQASEMNPGQQEMLRSLIREYVYNMETVFADRWMADIETAFEDTYFVWVGPTSPESRVYYRVYNPHVWIEYNNEGGGLDHLHTITRIPHGGDYGPLSLQQGPHTLLDHYASADHHLFHEAPFDYTIVESDPAPTNSETAHGHTH